MKTNLNNKYDVVTCLQVLEHIDDDTVYNFAQKLFTLGNIVIISVPYMWKKGICKYHKQDPVDETKLYGWTKKIPIYSIIIKDNHFNRIINVYIQNNKNSIVTSKFNRLLK